MKKNFTININGIIFHIDEDAYEKLNNYFSQLKRYFAQQEGGSEIVNDIEARIAELLGDRVHDKKQVITLNDVDEVIAVMGTPFEMEEDAEEAEQKASGQNESARPKRLFRDPDNKIIGGVGGGMGAYFNTDPLWFRLAFVLSFFVVGPLAYIVFWIAIPMARSTAEKLEMKGKSVNINSIEKSVKEELKDIGENLNNYANKAKSSWNQNKGRFSETGSTVTGGLEEILRFILKVFGVLVGVVLLITGLSLATSMFAFFFIPDLANFIFDDMPMTFYAPSFTEMFFAGGLQFTIATLGIILLLGLPVAGILLLAVRLIFGPRIKTGSLAGTGLLIWFVALFATALAMFSTARDLKRKESITEKVMPLPADKVSYQFKLSQVNWVPENYDDVKYIFNDTPESIHGTRDDFRGIPEVSFVHTNDTIGSIEIIASSHGTDKRDAMKRASEIGYGIQMEGNVVYLDPFFTIPEKEKFRAQDITVRINLAEGTTFTVDKYLEDISYPWFLDDKKQYILKDNKITKHLAK